MSGGEGGGRGSADMCPKGQGAQEGSAGVEDGVGVRSDDRAGDRGDMVRVEGPRRGARGAVHRGVVGAGRDGLPAEDTEERAERSRHGTCRLEGEEGGVVALGGGVAVLAGARADPADACAPVERRAVRVTAFREAEDKGAGGFLRVSHCNEVAIHSRGCATPCLGAVAERAAYVKGGEAFKLKAGGGAAEADDVWDVACVDVCVLGFALHIRNCSARFVRHLELTDSETHGGISLGGVREVNLHQMKPQKITRKRY